MICSQNCASCPFAAMEAEEKKDITVFVAGAAAETSFLDFSSSPVLRFHHRNRSLLFINFSGSDYQIGRKIVSGRPDIVLNLVDSTNLEHDLRLTSRLIDMDCRVALAFTCYDKLQATGHSIDYGKFSDMTGLPSITLGAYSDEAFSRLLSHIVDCLETASEDRKHIHIPYGPDIDKAINEITGIIARSSTLSSDYHDRYIAVRLLEEHEYALSIIKGDPIAEEIETIAIRKAAELEKLYNEPVTQMIGKARDGFIHGALQETLIHSKDNSDHSFIQRLDSVLTSKLLGFPILIAILLGIFKATFTLGAYPQAWIESGVNALSSLLKSTLPAGWFASLLTDGIVQGVGAVLAFLPNIIILFFFLSVLEDSGYMSRAAFLMDKLMHRIGLHGRSFIPMLIGFGCNVPAIMAARSIEDRKDRTLTMLMIPYMSCSARLPVYLLFVSAFFAEYKALVMISIYLLGIILSIIFAAIMKRTRYFRKDKGDYVSELPPFRSPSWRSTWGHIWERTSDYLKKISTVILAASVVIWALEYFPADRTENGRFKEESYLAAIGKGIEPVMKPLGYDWKMNVCLLTGLPAKEAIVSTMGILYHSEDDATLIDAMRRESGITPGIALSFMAFVLLYFPCIATIATLKRELGRKWALFSVVHSLLLAWVVAFLITLIVL